MSSLTNKYYGEKSGFPCGASGKKSTCQHIRCKRHGFDPWVGKIPGEGYDNPFQYLCLEKLGKLQSIGSHRVGHD